MITSSEDASRHPPNSAQPVLDVQGHRGVRGYMPENTLPAFQRALELGVSTLELDLGVTRDGAVVVAHDPFINPKLCLGPGGTVLAAHRGPLLRDLTLEEIRRFDCGILNPDPIRFPEPREKIPGTQVPTLIEVFELARRQNNHVRFNIEIKTQPGGEMTLPLERFVHEVVTVVRRSGFASQTTMQAFDWRALALVKRMDAVIGTVALVAPDTLAPLWRLGLRLKEFPSFLSLLVGAGCVDDFSPCWRHLFPGTDYLGHSVREYQAAGFRVIPWTVNDPEIMRMLLRLGVDGIITDFPDRLIQEAREARIPIL